MAPATIVLRTMEDRVDVQSFANNRKEDAIREPIRQNATDFVLSTNDSEKRGICGCAIGRSKNFVDQLFTEARFAAVRTKPRL